jgi:hypothetical protein
VDGKTVRKPTALQGVSLSAWFEACYWHRAACVVAWFVPRAGGNKSAACACVLPCRMVHPASARSAATTSPHVPTTVVCATDVCCVWTITALGSTTALATATIAPSLVCSYVSGAQPPHSRTVSLSHTLVSSRAAHQHVCAGTTVVIFVTGVAAC